MQLTKVSGWVATEFIQVQTPDGVCKQQMASCTLAQRTGSRSAASRHADGATSGRPSVHVTHSERLQASNLISYDGTVRASNRLETVVLWQSQLCDMREKSSQPTIPIETV